MVAVPEVEIQPYKVGGKGLEGEHVKVACFGGVKHQKIVDLFQYRARQKKRKHRPREEGHSPLLWSTMKRAAKRGAADSAVPTDYCGGGGEKVKRLKLPPIPQRVPEKDCQLSPAEHWDTLFSWGFKNPYKLATGSNFVDEEISAAIINQRELL